MYRPRYETANHLADEAVFAGDLGRVWGLRLVKLPYKYRLDYAGMQGGDVKAWIEVKVSTHLRGEYGTFIVSLDKWMSARSLSEATGLPCTLAVRFVDADVAYSDFGCREKPAIGFMRSYLKTRQDNADMQPVVRLPLRDFEISGTARV